jgi:hypothetical protein
MMSVKVNGDEIWKADTLFMKSTSSGSGHTNSLRSGDHHPTSTSKNLHFAQFNFKEKFSFDIFYVTNFDERNLRTPDGTYQILEELVLQSYN